MGRANFTPTVGFAQRVRIRRIKMVELKLTVEETEAMIAAVATFAVLAMPTEEMQGHKDALEPHLRTLTGKVSDAQKVSGLWK